MDVTDPVEEYHTYAVDWTAERIEWILDGTVVRTLEYADAVDGTNFPQTPMVVKIGIWAGGDPSNSAGTIGKPTAALDDYRCCFANVFCRMGGWRD